MLFVGVDWAEEHHDVCVMDLAGRVAAKGRVSNDLAGIAKLHDLIAGAVPVEVDDDDVEVIVGIETDRGLLVRALWRRGIRCWQSTPWRWIAIGIGIGSRAPSPIRVMPGCWRTWSARMLISTARSPRTVTWPKRSSWWPVPISLRSGRGGGWPTSCARRCGSSIPPPKRPSVTSLTPMPSRSSRWRRPPSGADSCLGPRSPALRRGGRKLNIETRSAKIRDALRSEQLTQPPVVIDAYGAIAASLTAVIAAHNTQIAELEEVLETYFGQHPDADILRSLPGLGIVTGARVLGEFGDDPPAMTRPRPDGTTPAPAPSPSPPAPDPLSGPATSATGASPMPCTGGPSTPSAARLAPEPSMTAAAPPATPTPEHYGSWPTASSPSSTAASEPTAPTTNKPPGVTAKTSPLDNPARGMSDHSFWSRNVSAG